MAALDFGLAAGWRAGRSSCAALADLRHEVFVWIDLTPDALFIGDQKTEGAAGTVARAGETAGVHQIDLTGLRVDRAVRVAEQRADAAVFTSFVIKILHAEANIFQMTVGDEKIAGLGFKDRKVGFLKTAVAVAADRSDRYAQTHADLVGILAVIAAVDDVVNWVLLCQFAIHVVDTVTNAVGIADHKYAHK